MPKLILPSRGINQPTSGTKLAINSRGILLDRDVVIADGIISPSILNPYLQTCPNGIASFAGDSATSYTQPVPTLTIGTGDFTIYLSIYLKNIQTSSYVYALGTGGASFAVSVQNSAVGANLALYTGSFVDSGVRLLDVKGLVNICIRRLDGLVKFFTEFGESTEISATASIGGITSIVQNSYQPNGGYGCDGGMYLLHTAIIPIATDDITARSYVNNPWQIFAPQKRIIYFDAGAGGGLNLSQTSRFDNSNSFYAHTVITGAVTLTTNLLSNGNTFYAHTVTQGGVTQTLGQSSSFQNSNSFYASTVTPGSINLTASLFTNATTLFNPSVTVGSVTLFADLLNNSNTFYNHIISTGGFALQQDIRLDNVNSFYGIEVTTGQVSLAANLFNNSNLFYGAVVSTGSFVLQQTSRFDNSGAFYEINVAVGSVTLTTNLFTNSNTFFTHTTSQASLLELTQSVRFDNTSIFYVAAVGAGTTLTPADIAAIMAAMRIEFATELARVDVTISSRLASVDYTAPNNAGIAALPNADEIATAVMHYTE